MHIDPDFHVFLMAIDKGSSTLRELPLNEALALMHSQQIDLIVYEPQQKAIFDKSARPNLNKLHKTAYLN